MRIMHLHSLWAENDSLHVRASDMLRRCTSTASQICCLSFLLTFGWLVHWPNVTDEILAEFCVSSSTDFAEACWHMKIVPITPRFHYSEERSWHRQLCKSAATGDQSTFIEIIKAAHAIRVLPLPVAQELADTLSLPTDGPVNRMQSCVRTLRAKKTCTWEILASKT